MRRRREDTLRNSRAEKKERREERAKEEEARKKEEREAEEGGGEPVEKEVTGWTEVTRKKKKMVQIFVKVDGWKTSAMEMETSDKVDDIVKKIPISDQDVYVASGGRILRRSDKMRGGGKVKRRRSKSCNWTTGCVRWRASK